MSGIIVRGQAEQTTPTLLQGLGPAPSLQSQDKDTWTREGEGMVESQVTFRCPVHFFLQERRPCVSGVALGGLV